MRPLVIKVRRSRLFDVLTGLLFLSIFGRYVLRMPIPRIAISGFSIVMAFMITPEQLLALMLSGIPFFSVFHNSLLYIGCTFVYVVRFSRDIRFDTIVLPILLLWIWELAHSVISPFSIIYYINFAAPYMFVMLILCMKKERLNYPYLVRYLSKCTLFMCVLYLSQIAWSSGFSIQAISMNMQRLGLNDDYASIEGGVLNPNTLGFVCLLSSIGVMQMYTWGQYRIGDLLIMICLLFFGALTMSRTYLVCGAITGVLWGMMQKGSWQRRVRNVLIFLLLLVAVLILMQGITPGLIDKYLGRFQTETGRENLFADYMEYLISDPMVTLFGIGVVNLPEKVLGISDSVPHNGLQELVVAWGVLGSIIFGVILLSMLLRSRQLNKKQTMLNALPFIVFFIKVQAGQLVTMPYNITMLAMSFISLCWSGEKEEMKQAG